MAIHVLCILLPEQHLIMHIVNTVRSLPYNVRVTPAAHCVTSRVIEMIHVIIDRIDLLIVQDLAILPEV